MPLLRPKLSFILPLLLGSGLLWGLTQWQPLSALAPLEHSLFIFPERFEPDTIYPDHGDLIDYKVTPLRFTEKEKKSSIASYLIDDSTLDIIDLTPEKWAYFLSSIRQNNDDIIIIAAPLSWSDASELSLQTLEHQINQTPKLVLGLNAEFNNTSTPLPPFLESSVISSTLPHSLKLPQIDFLTFPPSIKAPLFGISTVQGFVIESAVKGLKVPMLVRWGDSILPSTHLAALLIAHELTPADLIITPSGFLRLGQKGSIINIDSQGRATLPRTGNKTLSASQLLMHPEEATSSKIILAPGSPRYLNLLETHLEQTLSQKITSLKSYERWPLPNEIFILTLLTLILQTPRLWLTLPALAAIFITSVFLNHWFPVTPVALLLLTFLILPHRTPKKAL